MKSDSRIHPTHRSVTASGASGFTALMLVGLLGLSGGCGDDDNTGNNNNNNANQGICGDGHLDSGEACDDGAANSDTTPDACRSNCRLAGCGDGVMDTGEACDDGDTNSDDGCDSSCELEPGWDCSDTPCVPICGDDLAVGDETCDGTDLRDQTCVSIGQASGVLACNSLCEWDITGCTGTAICGNGVKEGNEGCDDSNLTPCDGCSATCTVEACGNGVVECNETCDDGDQDNTDDCPDGVNGTCRPATCGDGHVRAGVEACDNGNTLDGDGCSADCQSDETCGNGIIDTVTGETCDDATQNSNDPDAHCRTNCRLQRCGDGILDNGEECDDGNANSDSQADACRTTCVEADCGDGVVDNGEECDDGNANSDADADACRTTCVNPDCGDGTVDSGEECDEGGNNSDSVADACRTTCEDAGCGDGVIDSNEECDEGLNNSDDPDEACRTTCVAGGCGDGILDTAEDCEDGNSVDWDGCTSCGITEFQVNTYTAGIQGGVGRALAVAGDGSFLVVWTSRDQLGAGNDEDLFGQRFDSDGHPLGGEFQINTHTANRQMSPMIGMASNGQFVVTWQCYDRSGYYQRLFASDGTPTTGELALGHGVSDIAMADDGSYLIVYQASDSDGNGVYGQAYSNTGSTSGSPFPVNTYETGSQTSPKIGMAGSGAFVVAWMSNGQDGDGYGIYTQRFSSSQVKQGAEIPVNTTTTGDQYEHDVSMNNSGAFVITWRGGTAYDLTNIFAQRYSSTGATQGSEIPVNTYTTSFQWVPAVYLADDGSFVVAWSSDGQDGDGQAVYAQRYTSAGAATGNEFLLHVYTTDSQCYEMIDGSGGADFVAAWYSAGQDGDSGGVFAQRFDASGNPLGR